MSAILNYKDIIADNFRSMCIGIVYDDVPLNSKQAEKWANDPEHTVRGLFSGFAPDTVNLVFMLVGGMEKPIFKTQTTENELRTLIAYVARRESATIALAKSARARKRTKFLSKNIQVFGEALATFVWPHVLQELEAKLDEPEYDASHFLAYDMLEIYQWAKQGSLMSDLADVRDDLFPFAQRGLLERAQEISKEVHHGA